MTIVAPLPLAALAASLALAAAPAPPPRRGPARRAELGIEAQAGYFQMAASDSASAVFDATGGFTFGGAVRYVLARGFFVSAGARTFSKDGERVFVSAKNAPVAKLGFPLSLRLTPITATVGYRLRHGATVVPYAGAGGGVTLFREESEVAGEVFEESRTKGSFHVLAGVEVGRGTVRFGAEARYSWVPDAVGLGGVSKVYGETDLGGLVALGKVVVSLGRSTAKEPGPAPKSPGTPTRPVPRPAPSR